MTDSKLINVYCDESCHLETGPSCAIAWGAVICETVYIREIAEHIRAIKQKHGLSARFEAKWTKVSPAQVDFYLEIIDEFIQDGRLRFRGLLVPDKDCLDHARFSQTHDEWYYKMYYLMLQWIIQPANHYHIYLDIKDTQGGFRTRKLHEVLANRFHDFDHEYIERVQQIRSHESELMQITDIVLGALTYAQRGLATSRAKTAIIERIQSRLGSKVLTNTSPFGAVKFNLLIWHPREEEL